MNSDRKLTLKLTTPAGVYEGTFEVNAKVHDVIVIVVKAKGLVEGDAFELAFDGEPLPDDRPIGSFGFKDGTVLDLIASGSAV